MKLSEPFILYRLPNDKTVHLLYKDVLTVQAETIEPPQKNGFIIAPYANNQKAYLFTDKEYYLLSYNDILSLDFDIQLKEASYFNTDFESYKTQIADIQSAIQNKTVNKAVLSRIISLPTRSAPNLNMLLAKMLNSYPNAFVYMAWLPDTSLWCGATPETLARYNNLTFSTMALAGTQSLQNIDSQDIEWGTKEQMEQLWVQNHITQWLQHFEIPYHSSPTYTKTAAHLAHICTEYQGIADYNTAWKTVQHLHPTPAVCGTPFAAAYQSLQNIETHDRAFYSGFLGPIDTNQFSLFVNLRCMQISPDFYHLFVGGGITIDSDAKAEWEETQNKAKVMQQLIG